MNNNYPKNQNKFAVIYARYSCDQQTEHPSKDNFTCPRSMPKKIISSKCNALIMPFKCKISHKTAILRHCSNTYEILLVLRI
jgi:hypothetical protein